MVTLGPVGVRPASLVGPESVEFEGEQFVRRERQAWRKNRLLRPNALRDFQRLTDRAFRTLRRKYFSPADLLREMGNSMQLGATEMDRTRTALQFAPSLPRNILDAPFGLSLAKRTALIECLNNNGLVRQKGCWRGSSESRPISGMTVADLSRDGLLTIAADRRGGLAQLTDRGDWCARTLRESNGH